MAIGQTGMVKRHLPPIGRVVTQRTLAGEMIERLVVAMAVSAVGEARVVEGDQGPIFADMAVRALTLVVELGCSRCMT